MKSNLCLITLLIFTTFSSFAQKGEQLNFDVSGTVRDQTGAVVPGLWLDFDKDVSDKFSATDINGKFKVTLPIGDYIVTASELGIDRFKGFIKIVPNGPNPEWIDFVVDSSNLCRTSPDSPKVIKMVSPPVPPVARAVRALGTVVVVIRVNAVGKVILATATNGHPLLRAASAQAARQFEFDPSLIKTETELALSFVFVDGAETKENLERFRCDYRIVINAEPVLVEISEVD